MFLLIETKLHQFSKFVLIVELIRLSTTIHNVMVQASISNLVGKALAKSH